MDHQANQSRGKRFRFSCVGYMMQRSSSLQIGKGERKRRREGPVTRQMDSIIVVMGTSFKDLKDQVGPDHPGENLCAH